jgi:tryptophan halogenase
MECAEPMSALMAYNKVFDRRPDGLPAFHSNFSYHIENDKFVTFLEAMAASVGIELIEDTVRQVMQDESGITGLVLASGRTETADLYVDCSGFVSLLLGKTLKEPFISFKSSLFCDRAVVGGWTRGPDEPIFPYTTCSTMNSGWLWQIEHETRINRGYVYCSSFISDEEAEREFRATSPKVGATRVVRFISGRYERNWVKNVVAIGNASAFVEPLEATALGVIANQARVLTDSLLAADRTLRDSHRKYINQHHAIVWDAIRGFISIHYKFNTRLDTPFWRECREKTDISVAAAPVEYYQENGPCGFWGPLVVGAMDPFGMKGWATLLLGQRVPYRNAHRATDAETQKFDMVRQRYRVQAQRGLTAEEVLAAIRSPGWRWP